MDGHRLIGASQGQVFVSDYDSTNQNLLITTNNPDGGFFDRDYKYLFVTAGAADGSVILQKVDMRAGADLPKT
jgi:hypothetical protein